MARTLVKEIVDTRKNYIINGNFDFWQRGTSTSADSYLADRFIYVGSPDGGTAASYTVSRGSFAVSDTPVQEFGETQYYWRITNSTQGTSLGASSSHSVTTKPEDVGTLAGKAITVTFWARSSIAGKVIMMKPARRFGTGGSANNDTEISGQRFTLSSSWQKYTATFQMPTLAGKVIGTGSHLRFAWVFQVGSTLAAQYDGGAAITWQGTGTIDIAQVQVVEGSTVAPFNRHADNLESELAACQRYFSKTFDPNVAPANATGSQVGMLGGLAQTSGTIEYTWNFPVHMRVVPVIVRYGLNENNSNWNPNPGPTTSTVVVSGTNYVNIRGSSNIGQGNSSYIHLTADAEL